MLIGTIVVLKADLGSSFKKGFRGVCYSRNDFMETFYVIFENGKCAGFGPDDLSKDLTPVYLSVKLSTYEFDSMDKLRADFKAGIFRHTFRTTIN